MADQFSKDGLVFMVLLVTVASDCVLLCQLQMIVFVNFYCSVLFLEQLVISLLRHTEGCVIVHVLVVRLLLLCMYTASEKTIHETLVHVFPNIE